MGVQTKGHCQRCFMGFRIKIHCGECSIDLRIKSLRDHVCYRGFVHLHMAGAHDCIGKGVD